MPVRPNPNSAVARSIDQSAERGGVFTPLRHRMFAAFWTASMVSNFGVLIQGVGAAWLMTSLSASALMVTMVSVSTVLPIVLLSLFAGAAADIWDKRWIMLAAQSAMFAVAAALAATTYFGFITPLLLILFTFLLGCGFALYAPSAQSSIGDLVPRTDLAGAVALNSLGFNLARSVGPAIGGAIVSAAGPEAAFALNAITYVGLITVLFFWRPKVEQKDLPPETLSAAMVGGLRYAFLSPEIRTVLLRGSMFGMFASSLPALMPLIARTRLEGSSLTYGLLLGLFGAGSVVGALFSARIRKRFANETVLRAVSVALGAATGIIAVSHSLAVTLAALVVAGAAWVLALSMFIVIVQLSAPRWVVGRLVAVNQMVIFGGFALGGLLWGALTEAAGLTAAIAASGTGIAVAALLGIRFPISTPQASDASGAAEPRDEAEPAMDPRSGPIVTTVEYRVQDEDAPAFLAQIWELRGIRRRYGGRQWAVLRVISDPEVWIERFQSATWIEYLRQNRRLSSVDAEVRRRVEQFHEGPAGPRVQHSLESSPASFGIDGRGGSPAIIPDV